MRIVETINDLSNEFRVDQVATLPVLTGVEATHHSRGIPIYRRDSGRMLSQLGPGRYSLAVLEGFRQAESSGH
ncbi:MAG: hypothetical protein M3410_17220 [Acidobacteriota bacterium]|nr:hypothetical protein [Acidobacteriota bacterium]